MNYDTLPDGRPTPAHKWEEQFKGRKGPPPVEALRVRLALLRAAIAKTVDDGFVPVKGWVREAEWRVRQLGQQGFKEETDGESEHQV